MTAERSTISPDAIADIVFVGSAMAPIVEQLAASDAPLRARHLAAIDDLLAHVEDHAIECAIVDQSQPTESRGLKLALLAASRKVGHLIVLAPPGSRAEIEAIHGVHQVLRTPIAPRQIMDAARNYVGDRGARLSLQGDSSKPSVPQEGETVKSVRPGVIARLVGAARPALLSPTRASAGPRPRNQWLRFLPLANLVYKKLAVLILASLFALFVCYGVIIVFFLTSSSWSLPIELSSGHEMVARAEKDLGEMKVRQNQVSQALAVVESAIAIAERDKRDAKLRLEIAARSIDLELSQQHKLLQETKEHILRLKQIIADFRNANGRGTFARNLEKAYETRTITKKSLEAGTLAILESLHRMALVSNELAIKQIEEDRINTRVEFLKSLRGQLDKPEIRILTAASSDLVYIARDAIADQNMIAQADQRIHSQSAEAKHLRDSLDVVQRNIASLLATPVGRAITQPVTVVFVPYENAANFEDSQPLYRCALMVVLCAHVGQTGAAIPGETNAVHPLFGKPLRGVFVEAVLDDKNDAKEEILHAGRPLLFF